MVIVKLPDGRSLEQADGISVAEALQAADPRLVREAIAARLDGRTVDLATRLSSGTFALEPLRAAEAGGLDVLRHSCAHVMAEAVCGLWPQARLVYGPPVENGFYYDIELDHNLTPEDFPLIEARMAEIVKADRPFTRYDLPRAAAMDKLAREGNPYKLDNAQRADGDTLSFYVTGPRDSGCWEDLCRGPHVPSTRHIGAFKVMQVAGAYHRGDATKQMLQRVYGTAWPSKKELNAYLQQLEEAKKRDHRKLGPELGLFAIDPLVGTGLILWKPRGAVMRHALESFIREELLKRGYQPVYTPHIGRLELYRTSGHYPYYKDGQYPPLFESDRARLVNALWEVARVSQSAKADAAELELFNRIASEHEELRKAGYPADAPVEERVKRIRSWLAQEDGYLLKPMNCPHHLRIYGSEARSYRDLPIRLAEFGTVYRYEQSGEVGGLTRVRGLTQDDAHIFCTPEQLQQELAGCVEMAKLVLEVVGLTDYRVQLSLRDDSDKYIGSRELWEEAERAVRAAVNASGLPFHVAIGEAAFYGPKIDFLVRDCIGREWQLGTVQCDYNLPQRFDLKYIGDDNREHKPVMVHRAPLGSMERFIGILIEHFAGAFPLWLAPIQTTVCSVSEKSAAYAGEVFGLCRGANLRVELDASDDRIGAKIRAATMMKVPYILVVGEQEAASRTVNVRTREGKQYGNYKLPEFLAACAIEIASRGQMTAGGIGQAPSN